MQPGITRNTHFVKTLPQAHQERARLIAAQTQVHRSTRRRLW
jgi:hypothetical protein